MTQRALAERAGVPQPTIAAIESGAQDPRFRTLERLVRACGHDLDIWRHGGEGEDRTLFRANLRLTPAERLRLVDAGASTLRALRSTRRAGRA
jgi:transcriptional regulator with XRE-family HTH domain